MVANFNSSDVSAFKNVWIYCVAIGTLAYLYFLHGRFGGDEFTIFYPDMDPDTAKERAGSILSMLSAAFEEILRQNEASVTPMARLLRRVDEESRAGNENLQGIMRRFQRTEDQSNRRSAWACRTMAYCLER